MQVTTELLVFIGMTLAVTISVVLYMNKIDNRVTVLESTSLSKEDFHDKIDELKEEIRKIQSNKNN